MLFATIYELTRNELIKSLNYTKLEKRTLKELKKKDMNTKCAVCSRKINDKKKHKALPCLSCRSLVHRRCSNISIYDLNNSLESFSHWECILCKRNKFQFSDIEDETIVECSFNSNFNCFCKTIETPVLRRDHILRYTKFDRKEVSSVDHLNMIDDCLQIKTKFDYFNVHEFHKLTQPLKHNKEVPFSIYHTNVQSLICNFENLEDHLIRLEFQFDLICLSETWNSNSRKAKFKPPVLNGYNTYSGKRGTTLKSGCGFYIKESPDN